MSSARVTRSSVLGKRPHHSSSSHCNRLIASAPLTPEQSPDTKRPRVSTTLLDGDSNKENVPPFQLQSPGGLSPITARAPRTIRRTSTELSTPSRPRPGPRKHASTSDLATTTTPISRLTLATPPPTPPSFVPIYARARALLRPLSNSTASIAGREQERDQITNFVKSFLQDEMPACPDTKILYISGLPGTGKTALVDSVLRDLGAESMSTRIVSVNCMALQGIDALWDRLLEDLDNGTKRTTGKAKKSTGKKGVDLLLSGLSNKCILVLDELDHVAASIQSLVSVFSLPQSNPSCLRIIGIANTHTLTSSASQFSNHGIDGVDTIHFAPYTAAQLLAILQSRLTPLYANQDTDVSDQATKLLPPVTLTLLTKKIAAQSGDVRSLFEVIRGAIDIAVAAPSRLPGTNTIGTPPPVVTTSNILAALKVCAPATTSARPATSLSGASAKMSCNSETITTIRNLGFQARLVLLSLLLASKRLDAGLSLSSSTTLRSPTARTQSVQASPISPASAATDVAQLHAYYSHILTRTENEIFTPVSRSELGDLVGILETVGLATLSSSLPSRSSSPSKSARRAFGRTSSSGSVSGKCKDQRREVKLAEGVRCGEILRGLGVVGDAKNEAGADIREEEVRAIWEREKAALTRDAKANTGDHGLNTGDLFDGAMED